MTPQHRILDFYATPVGITSAGRRAALLDSLPNEPTALIRAVQGIAIHEYLATAYGFRVPDERTSETHIRPVERMLDRVVELDPRPLTVARPVEKRLVGICRHFEVLLVTLLRAKGIPARARRGFGAYFDKRMLVDHEITEYWNATDSRWQRVDPQLDDVQRATLHVTFDPLNVPDDQFLIASVAWERCRAGTADPKTFGIFDMNGLWFVASNLIRDVAWLNKHEILPWDVWGAMPKPDEQLDADRLAFFDRLAMLTRDPDATFDELREVYEHDTRLRVPDRVFNATLNREEAVA
jgi:hypothetical protein